MAIVLLLLASPAGAQEPPPGAPAVAAGPAIPRLRPRDAVDGDCASTWIAPAGESFGALTFEGGFVLERTTRHFGGLSGIDALDATTLFAIGDTARLAKIEILEDVDGQPVARCTVLDLVDESGARLDRRRRPSRRKSDDADSEGIVLLSPDLIAVSFERSHRVAYFRVGEGAAQVGTAVDFSTAHGLEPNRGIEALAVLPGGEMVAGAERPTLFGGGQKVWRLTPARPGEPAVAAPESPTFEIPAGPGFALVGLDATPRGALVTLERFYTQTLGNRTRVGWLPPGAAESASGSVRPRELALLTGEGLPIDNFEGVAATPGEDGRTVLWLVSDDNFADRQRTLLYRFSFDEDALEGG